MSAKKTRPPFVAVPFLLSLLALAGCSTVYYSAWEKLGVEKRDLLRKNVEAVREDQEEVSEQFVSALDRIKEIYGIDGGELEKHYEKVKNEYERSEAKADQLRGRIDRVEEIAADLFAEWQEELETISDAGLRRRSRSQLDATRERYRRLESALASTERRLDPVLQKFQDQVLFLKHNLNARAVGSLEVESEAIEADVARLIADLKASIRQTDAFIAELPR